MQSLPRKAEIVEQIRTTHQPLDVVLAQLDEKHMTQPGVNGEWSVKDVMAHITWWEQHFLRRLRTGRDDLDTDGVDEGTATDSVNAEIFASNRDRPLVDVRADFDASYREVLVAIEAMSVEELASDDVFEAIGWDTFRHYEGHSDMLSAWLAATSGGGA